MAARDEVLARLRLARGAATPPEIPREYRRDDTGPVDVDLFVDRLVDYKALVTRCDPDGVAPAVAGALEGVADLVVPADVPEGWLSAYPGRIRRDAEPLSVADLDASGAVLTGCAAAIAETGTIVLDAGPAQGRRAITLVPDRHVVVVRVDQIVGRVPEALPRLAPTRPQTWISGPSATSDIELNRVEGVHGPRTLDVVILRSSVGTTPGK